MASYFISSASGAGGAGNGSSWANAYLTFAAAIARPLAVGDTLLVGDDHTEFTNGSLNIGLPSFGTAMTPNNILVVDHTKASPSFPTDLRIGTASGGMISGNNNIVLNFSGYVYGLYINCGVSSSGSVFIQTSGSRTFHFDSCTFVNSSTGAAARIFAGGGSGWMEFRNCTFLHSNAQNSFNASSSYAKFIGCTFTFTGTCPSPYFGATNGNLWFTLEGCDFSSFTGAYLLQNNSNGGQFFTFKDCKLPSGQPLFSDASALRPSIDKYCVINSDSGASNYKNDLYDYSGEQHVSTAVVRTGGASQGTPYSWNVTTNANIQWYVPFFLTPLSIWNAATGAAKNVTVEGIANPRDFSALPNNDDIWFAIAALENASFPQATYRSGTKAGPLATGSALSASTAAWDGAATARANSHVYAAGDIFKVASNPGRLFMCTFGGTSAGSEPGGYATAVDGGSITDGSATIAAMWRFKQTIATGTIQMAGLITVYPKVAKASVLFGVYIDPMITLS